MATKEPTTLVAASTATNDFPVFDVPDNAEIDDCGATLSIGLPEDPVSVRVLDWGQSYAEKCEVRCEGTGPALVSAGIIAPDWLVDGRRSWCVALQEAGPRLVVGGRGRPKGRYMVLRNHDGGRYSVSWNESGLRCKEYGRRVKVLRERSGKPKQAPDARKEGKEFESPEDRVRRTAGLADAMLNELRGFVTVEHKGLKLSVESQQRILHQLAELRRAFAEARAVVVVPKYERVENIICWPGRGRVAQVAPTALF